MEGGCNYTGALCKECVSKMGWSVCSYLAWLCSHCPWRICMHTCVQLWCDLMLRKGLRYRHLKPMVEETEQVRISITGGAWALFLLPPTCSCTRSSAMSCVFANRFHFTDLGLLNQIRLRAPYLVFLSKYGQTYRMPVSFMNLLLWEWAGRVRKAWTVVTWMNLKMLVGLSVECALLQ